MRSMVAFRSSWRAPGTNTYTAQVYLRTVSRRYHLSSNRHILGAARRLSAANRIHPLSVTRTASSPQTCHRRHRITAIRTQPGRSAADGAGPEPSDNSGPQQPARQRSTKDSADLREQAARLQELQHAIELELGGQHRLQPPQLTRSLGRALAARPDPILRDRVRALKVAIGAEAAAALLRSDPRLVVHVQPSEVSPRLDAWAAAFGTDRARIVQLCSRVGSAGLILKCRPADSHAKVQALCRVLQLGPEELLALCAKYTRVLMVGPEDVAERAAALGEGLRLDAAQVVELCRVRPAVLASPSSSVMEAVEAVRVALGVPREEAVQACVGCPCILGKSCSSILEKARALKRHLGLEGRDLKKCMMLFSIPAPEVATRLAALPAALGIPAQEALLLVREEPQFLVVAAAALAASWSEIRRAARMQPEWREQVGGWSAATFRSCVRRAEWTRRRVDAVLALGPDAEKLPALSSLLSMTEPAFAACVDKVRSGEVRPRTHAPKRPEAVIRVRYQGLWGQL